MVVIEAIKLLESDLAAGCDTIWVVDAPEEMQVARLMHKRNMSEAAARQRIAAQPPQSLKVRAAKVIVHNDGNFENTWDQVQTAWSKLPTPEEPLLPTPPPVRPGRSSSAAADRRTPTRSPASSRGSGMASAI